MDGTLTVPMHDFDAIRAELGLAPGPILEQLATLPPERAPAIRAHLQRVEEEIADRSIAQDGARALLDTLAARGARKGILTRNSLDNAWRTLRACGLHDHFEPPHVLGRDEAVPKPSADGILRLLAAWGGRPEDAVMVGDFEYDLMAGRAAGTATVYVDVTGAFPYRALADVAVARLDALLRGM
ncbi:MAG: HAD family hydrolase [Planctomycetes bacterium]|nr:HAD family hydrolase [Planctomycetota bacterium]